MLLVLVLQTGSGWWLQFVLCCFLFVRAGVPATLSIGGGGAGLPDGPPEGILGLPSWGLSPSLGRVSPGAVLAWAMEGGNSRQALE